MRIIWTNQFQVLFDLKELQTVKAAGFKTSGPPDWHWTTAKASVVKKLGQTRPGLKLSKEAHEKYQKLIQQEETKAALKKQFQKDRKVANKQSEDYLISGLHTVKIPAKGYIDASDLPASNFTWKFVSAAAPDAHCILCGDPLYFYELPDICLFCEK